jgi:UDP:flavonoid glycosyltransferase YjiC (YdhE family)
MRSWLIVETEAEAADIRRALNDPQVRKFVLQMGGMLRRDEYPGRIAELVESTMFSWRINRNKRKKE